MMAQLREAAMRMEFDAAAALRCKAAQFLRLAREVEEALRPELQALAADYARRAHTLTRDRTAP